MDKVRQWVKRILKRSYLTRREKQLWAEEMEDHLRSSIEQLKEQGYSPDEAMEKSLHNFGTPDEVNHRLTKETYGMSGETIRRHGISYTLLLILSLVGGPLLNLIGYHNRYIEIMPVIMITLLFLNFSLLLTRKHIDRICLVSVPILFVLGYLQSYFGFIVHSFGNHFDFTMFANLFFSGVYDRTGSVTDYSFELMGIGSFFLAIQSLILYLFSRNKNIALLPFGLSIALTLTHMVIFRIYFFTSPHFPSPVYNGYERFTAGESIRMYDIAVKLFSCLLIFLVTAAIEKYSFQRKKRIV